VQVRARGSAAAAAKADGLPGSYYVPLFYLKMGKMQVKAQKSLAMVDHHEPSLEIKWLGQEHRATIDRMHRSARRGGEIQPQVPALDLAVEHAFSAEDIRNGD